MRASKFLFSMEAVLLVSQLSALTLPLSLPFFKLRLQTARFSRRSKTRKVRARRRSSSTGMMGVRRKNVMKKVAS